MNLNGSLHLLDHPFHRVTVDPDLKQQLSWAIKFLFLEYVDVFNEIVTLTEASYPKLRMQAFIIARKD